MLFLFSPQGSQYAGMGQDRFRDQPVFRDCIKACSAASAAFFSWSLEEEFQAPPSRYRLHDDPECIQPALTAVQIALVETLREAGVRPQAVAGLSMGEIAGGYATGALDLEGAMTVACAVGKVSSKFRNLGAMCLLKAGQEQVRRMFRERNLDVRIALDFNAEFTVVSGLADAMESAKRVCESEGVLCIPLSLSMPFHTDLVRRGIPDFLSCLAGYRFRASRIPFFSSLQGARKNPDLSPEHWAAILSEPASVSAMASNILGAGVTRILEIGAKPILDRIFPPSDPVIEVGAFSCVGS